MCSTIPGPPERRLRPPVGTPATLRRARWAAAWLRRAGADGRAIRALAAIEGAAERRTVPEAALATLLRRPLLAPPLAWMAAARQIEPSSISRIARGLAEGGRPGAALRIVAAARGPFPADASLRRDHLRLLERLGHHARLIAEARALGDAPDLDGDTGFLLRSLVQGLPAASDIADRLRDRFTQSAPPLEQARFARRDGRLEDAIDAYRRALRDAGESERRPILREAARAILPEDVWPGAIDLVEAAVRDGAIPAADAPAGPILAVAARNPRPLLPLPELAFADLAHLPVAAAGARGPVLMVGNSLRCGGMERVLAATTAGLAARGVDVRLALAERPGASAGSRFFLAASGMDEGAILGLEGGPGAAHPLVAALPRRWRGEAAAIAAHIASLRPRLVHAWNDRLGLIAALAALPAGVPVVLHVHHMRPTRDPAEAAAAAAYPACLRRLLARPDVRLVFCAAAAARDYADWLGVPPDPRFHVVHNGFPAEPATTPAERAAARRRFALPPHAPVIASLFRFEPVKQPLLWLETAARIAAARPDAHFLMAGDGELLAETQARAAELGLAPRMRFPGRLADPRAALAAADLLMMTSASEGLPNGAVEAQMAGVPVLAFDVGGMAETMRAEISGRLVPAGAVDALAREAVALLSDPLALNAAGVAARAFAGDAFAMNTYLDAIEAVYGTLQ